MRSTYSQCVQAQLPLQLLCTPVELALNSRGTHAIRDVLSETMSWQCNCLLLQVVTSADVFGIYMEGVQQHLDDAFANKGHPDASPHFPPAAAALFANSSLAPPQSDAQASKQQTASEQGAAQPQQVPAQVSEDAVSLSSATPQMQDAAAPEAAAAPAAEHTAAELPAGPAQDAAAATAANGIPTAIVPTDNDVVVEAVTAPAAAPKDANAAEAAAPNGESDVPGGNQR